MWAMSACGGSGGQPASVTSSNLQPPPAASVGAATLSWTPPTQREDGSALTTLAGYRIYYGTTADILPTVITVQSVGITSYVIENLAPGTYYFAVTALDSSGLESPFSDSVSKTIP